MSTETNKATVRRMIEQVWNEHRLDLVEEFYSEDVILHSAGFPSSTGLEAVRAATAYFHQKEIAEFCLRGNNYRTGRKAV